MRLLLTFFVILVHTAFPASGDSGAALLMHEAFGPVDAGDALGSLDSPGFGEHMPDVDGASGLADLGDGTVGLGDGGDGSDAVGDAGDAVGGFFEDGLDIFD